MSVYIPTVWRNNTTPSINANNLNHLEAGTKAAHDEIEDVITGVTPAGHATQALVADEIRGANRLRLGGVRLWVDLTDPTSPVGHIEV